MGFEHEISLKIVKDFYIKDFVHDIRQVNTFGHFHQGTFLSRYLHMWGVYINTHARTHACAHTF